jgi:hypothetical protein
LARFKTLARQIKDCRLLDARRFALEELREAIARSYPATTTSRQR